MNKTKLTSVVVIIFAMVLACWAAEPPAVTNKSTVLLLGGGGSPQWYKLPGKVAKELKAQGIETAWRASLPGITPEYLRQFNVVVLYTLASSELNDETKKAYACLRAYVQEGGGLLIFKDLYMALGMRYWREFLTPLDVQILNEDIIESDPSKNLTGILSYSWTDVIEKHPATEGVEGLAYPQGRCEPGEPAVITFKADANWKVLVRTKPTAASFIPDPAANERKVTGPGTYSASVPLLAVRDYGKGRIALWPWLATFTLMDGYSMILDDGFVMSSEQKGMKSEGAKLVYNLLRWLSEPSLQTPGFGNYKPTPVKPITMENELGFMPVDWNKVSEFGPAFKNCYIGLIGARTALSTGEGSPEEFISAAKAAGYQFIAFCEDINGAAGAMPKANWDKLVESCKKGTDATFLALPGIYYLDFSESAFVILGDIGYPPASWVDPKNPAKKIHSNATVRMGATWIPPIIMLPFKENTRPARLYSSFYGYAGQVWEGDKLRVEDWDTYQQLQSEGLALFPTAVHIVKKPAEVAEARRRGMQAFVRADSISNILESIDSCSSAHYRWFKPAFPSTGPEICAFYAENWGTSNQSLFLLGYDRFRIRMMARSEKGLAEVQLLDNGRLVRRFILNGAKEFKKEIDEYHSKQHSYVMVVTDVDGGKAVSWSRNTNVQEYYHVMCSDNMNDMTGGKHYSFDRGLIELAGTETSMTPRSPANVYVWPHFEGGTTTDGARLKDLGQFAALKQSVLVGRFGGICEYSLDNRYETSGQPGIAYQIPIVANPYFRGKLRRHICRRVPPGADLEIVNYDFTIKQDVVLNNTPGLWLAGGGNWNLPNNDSLSHLVFFAPQGECAVEAPTTMDGTTHRSTTVKPGEYVGAFPQATAIFALDSELISGLTRVPKQEKSSTTMTVGIGRKGETLKAGTRIQKTLAVVSLPLAAKGTYSWLPEYKTYNYSDLLMIDVRRKMGLMGPPAYQVTPRVGAVENTQLVLRLKTENFGFRGKITQCHLPLPLPVFIAPLNWRWSAGIWYKGKNKLLSVDWPPKDEYGLNANENYVNEYEKVDEIIRFDVFDTNTGYLQLDLEGGERDVFIGNFVTCNRPEFFLTLHRDCKSGKGSVEVHNPTDKAESVTVKPAKGFDLFGEFTKKIDVPAGASVLVDISE